MIDSEESPHYTNKIDIWAIGCVFFELVSRKKAFVNDWVVCQFKLQGRSPQPLISDINLDEKATMFIMSILRDTLEIDPRERPAASKLHDRFVSWRVDVSSCTNPLSSYC